MPRSDVDVNFINESQKEVNSPVTFFILKIDPTDVTKEHWLYFVSYYKDLVFDGVTYTSTGGISREDIKNDSKTIPTCSITLSNVNQLIGQQVKAHLSLFYSGVLVTVYTTFLDINEAVVSSIRDDFEILGCAINDEAVVFECQSSGAMDEPIPRLYYSKTMCRFYFGDTQCDPDGTLDGLDECNRTRSTCLWEINTGETGFEINRFGGFSLIKDMRGLWV